MLKNLLSILLIITLLMSASSTFAAGSIHAETKTNDIIEAYAEAVNKKDWSKYIELLPSNQQQEFKSFVESSQHLTVQSGVLGVHSVKLKEIKELTKENISAVVNIDKYSKTYSDLRFYLVGLDFTRSIRKVSIFSMV